MLEAIFKLKPTQWISYLGLVASAFLPGFLVIQFYFPAEFKQYDVIKLSLLSLAGMAPLTLINFIIVALGELTSSTKTTASPAICAAGTMAATFVLIHVALGYAYFGKLLFSDFLKFILQAELALLAMYLVAFILTMMWKSRKR
jgi:hypothetical protein